MPPAHMARPRMLAGPQGSAVIASDAHGRGRQPALTAAVAALAIAGVAHPRRFAESRPAALLASGLQRPANALAA